MKETLSFEDVLLVPQKSDIVSRSEVNLTSTMGNHSFELPIIASPMDTVTETVMASTMKELGALGIIHRYASIEEQCEMISPTVVAAAVGVSGDFKERVASLKEVGLEIVCLDVAHGHHSMMEAALKHLRDTYGNDLTIIAGNVATPEGYRDLSEWGADAVRIGIGGGSICSTRIQTGHGVPTFQSVLDCKYVDADAKIIADGGIKTAGDMVKAIAAGADFVMLGSMLAGTDESPGQVFVSGDDKKYKVYRGMASVEAQVDWRGEARSLEGVSTTIPHKGSVTSVMSGLKQNIRSGLSYSGARTIEEFQAKARFIRQTSASMVESGTHILNGR